MSYRALLVAAVIAGCGVSSEDEESLCSDAPVATDGNFVTQAGCAYEQQTDNITRHGTMVSMAGTALRDATGASAGTVQYSCGRYLMGKDTNGVGVIIDSTTGEVRSHGRVHAGFPVSSLPKSLQLPLAY